MRADRLDDLVALGTLTAQAAAFLDAAVAAGLNVLVSGGTRPARPPPRETPRWLQQVEGAHHPPD